MLPRRNRVSRRAFVQGAALGVGGLALSRLGGRLGMPASAADTGPVHAAIPGTNASLILVNGRVVTMDVANTVTQAIAIRGDKVMQTGTNAAMRALAGPNTEVIDLCGRTVTPGLVDAHAHLGPKGLIGTAYIDVNPPGVSTVAELQAKIAEGCAQAEEDEWVVAQGYITFEGEYVDKTMLDPVSPHNPVMLINQGGHMGAVNQVALDMAHVNASTANPPFGIITRDEDGEPTGALVNHSAMDIFRALWDGQVITPTVRHDSVVAPQREFAAYGITTFGDVNVRGLNAVQAYCDVARDLERTIRGYILNTIEYASEFPGRPAEIAAILYQDDYLHFGGFKFLLDGALAAAYTRQPHNGTVWNLATWNQGPLNLVTSAVHEMGYQCSFHCVGDAAVGMALNAIEYAMNKDPRPDPRHRIEHAVLNSADDLQRTRDLGVLVNTQPHGIYTFGDGLVDMFGAERASSAMPTRSWLDLGVPLSLSSDCPTLPYWEPPIVAAAAVNRLTSTNRALGPDQVMTVDEVFRAYTMGGAYACFEEEVKGSLEPGKFADLAVWRLDPWVATLNEMMAENPVDLTFVGGKVVFQRVRTYMPLVTRS